MKRVLRFFLLLLLMPMLSLANSNQEPLSEDNSLLMAVVFYDGALVSDSMSVYRAGQKWLLPLGELAGGMDIALKISTALKQAEGFIVDERRTVSIDLNKCILQKSGQRQTFDCAQAFVQNNEIFVDADLFEKIFDVKTNFDLNGSLITISAAYKFPVQLKSEREQNAKAAASQGASGVPSSFVRVETPSKIFSGASIDQQLGVVARKGETHLTYDSAISAQVAGLDAKIFIGGEDSKVSESSVNLARKDPEGGLLGVLNAREVQALDLSAPTVPLLTTGGRVRGVLLSNFDLNSTNSFSTHEFRGTLPSGWDVELYQNDTLVGRFATTDSAEYLFKDVPLFYGINRFSLIFYGPQGQRREEVQVINVDGSTVAPGETRYRLVQGKRRNSNRDLTLLQVSHGITSRLGFSAAYFRGAPKENQKDLDYGQLGGSIGLGRLLFGGNFVASTQAQSGSAAEYSVQAPFEHFNLGLSHTRIDNFSSEQLNPDPAADPLTELNKIRGNASLTWLLGLQLSLEAIQSKFKTGDDTWTGLQRTTMRTGDIYWFNTLNYEDSADHKYSGELSNLYVSSALELRSGIQYQRSPQSANLNILKRFSSIQSVDFSVQNQFASGDFTYGLGWNRFFKVLTASADFSLSSEGHWQALGMISFGTLFSANPPAAVISGKGLSDTGALSALVYLDLNHNRIRDPGEPPLPGMRVQVNNHDSSDETDKDGRLLLTRLPVYQLVGLSLSLKSLADPMYRPMEKGYSMVLRPATTESLEFPVGVFSEITGIVTVSSERADLSVRGVQLKLLNAKGEVFQTTQSESDGFYAFEGVPPGQYIVAIEAQGQRKVKVPETGLEHESFDFVLE